MPTQFNYADYEELFAVAAPTYTPYTNTPIQQNYFTTPNVVDATQFYNNNLNDVVGYILAHENDVVVPINMPKSKTTVTTKPLCCACVQREYTIIINKKKWCDTCANIYTKLCYGGCGTRLMHGNVRGDYDVRYTKLFNACPEVQALDDNNPFQEQWLCVPCSQRKPELLAGVWACTGCNYNFTPNITPAIISGIIKKCPRCKYNMYARLAVLQKFNANVLEYLQPYKAPASGLQFGIELEVQCGVRSQATKIEMVRNLMPDFIICKHDGSLLKRPEDYSGFEIVSVPATVEEHKQEWTKLLETKHGLISWKTGDCGMHVHITRKALSMLQIGRMLKFVNSTDNAKLIQIVAGRHSTKYSTIYDKNITDVNTPMTGDHDYDRRQAVNLSNKNTVELRIFRGNMKPESFFKNLEFTAALVGFCKDTSNDKLDTVSFLSYVDYKRYEYPYLVKFFCKVNLMERKMRPSQTNVTNILGLKALEKDKLFTFDNM